MTVTIERLNAEGVKQHHAAFIDLICNVVDNGASVNFIAPLDRDLAASYWQRVEREVAAGERIVLAAFDAGKLVGTVHLALAGQPNGIHRAEVQKLLVHSDARGKGVAKALMARIEEAAKEAKRSLLVLDTEKGSIAETLYARIGYERAGEIPRFAANFDGSDLITTVLFYRLI
jgi:acetyltransferase